MLIGAYTINDCILRANNFVSKIKDNQPPETFNVDKAKALAIYYDAMLGVEELRFILRDKSAYIETHEFLKRFQDLIFDATMGEELRSLLRRIVGRLEELPRLNNNDVYNCNRVSLDFFQEMLGNGKYSLSNDRSLITLISRIRSNNANKIINVFAPDCYDGETSKLFCDINENTRVYANEKTDSIRYAKEKLFKVVRGQLKGSKIQNEAFDVLYAFPRIYCDVSNTSLLAGKLRKEKEYIQDLFKYLRNDGVMIITMPVYRLYKDICIMLSKQLKNIRVINAGEQDFDNIGLVHIIGQKDYTKTAKENEFEFLRDFYNDSNVIYFNQLNRQLEYIVPDTNIDIETFKGSALDMDELEALFDKSYDLNDVINAQRVPKIHDNAKTPLLPFNIGQLGLILTSGCLDGIVEEDDGCHLIKGRVSKDKIESREVSGSNVEVTETEINKIEINVLLPNGDYKKLA